MDLTTIKKKDDSNFTIDEVTPEQVIPEKSIPIDYNVDDLKQEMIDNEIRNKEIQTILDAFEKLPAVSPAQIIKP